jgi:hypothetical protein
LLFHLRNFGSGGLCLCAEHLKLRMGLWFSLILGRINGATHIDRFRGQPIDPDRFCTFTGALIP